MSRSATPGRPGADAGGATSPEVVSFKPFGFVSHEKVRQTAPPNRGSNVGNIEPNFGKKVSRTCCEDDVQINHHVQIVMAMFAHLESRHMA